MMKYLISFICCLMVTGCLKDTHDYIEEVPVKEFCEGLSNKNVQLIDVRTIQEFENGHIDGARLMDIQQEERFLSDVQSLNKKEPVYIYCRSGNRTKIAAGHLANNGFKQITELKGGYLAWTNTDSKCRQK